jgi:AraC family transcriptional regulator
VAAARRLRKPHFKNASTAKNVKTGKDAPSRLGTLKPTMPLIETILPVLVHIQSALDGDLSLEAVARKAGLSPFHFHRSFKESVGETLRAYVERLRLERAAFRLALYEAGILDIALDSGFQNHETFTRAFRRRFGTSPREFRESGRAKWPAARRRSRELLDDPGRGFELSALKIVRLRETHLAFIRHVGPYESVSETLWDELEAWARSRKLDSERVLMGIGHDSPATTPPERLRFDAAIRAPGRFATEGRIAHQVLPAGDFASVEHVGPYATLPLAYQALFPQLMQLKGYRVVGLPVLEIYHTTRIKPAYELNHTGIYLPVTKVIEQ